jgi:hypothetical protein
MYSMYRADFALAHFAEPIASLRYVPANKIYR